MNDEISNNKENNNREPNDLLKKIYYPDTLYPDKYVFFANRRAQSMDASASPSTISRQMTIDNDTIENQRQQSSAMLDRERGETDADRRRFDFKRFLPSALRTPDKTQPPAVLLEIRFYTLKKTAMTILCLLIIIMSNSVQLKHVLKQGSTHPFYSTQVFLGIISVLITACIGVILMYVMRIDLNDQYKQYKLDYIDNAVICLLFILAIFNIFIAACS